MIIVWRVTERCNLACRFCGFDRTLHRSRADADPEEVDAFGAVLSRYRRETGQPVLVSWLGGEPLLWPHLSDLTRRFVCDYGLAVSATTNGAPLASPTLREHIVRYYAELTVSVDGIGPTHDALRRWKNGYKALRWAVSSLVAERQRAGRGPRIRANMVLTRDNALQLFDLAAELAGMGFDEMTFNQLGGRHRPGYHSRHRLLPEQADWIAREAPRRRPQLAHKGIQLRGGDDYLERLRASSRDVPVRSNRCRPGEGFLFIEVDGRAGPCSDTSDSCGVSVRRLDSVAAIEQLPREYAHTVAERRPKACEDCTNTRGFRKFETEPPPYFGYQSVLEARL